MAKKTYTLHLAKPGYRRREDILTETAIDKLDAGLATRSDTNDFGEGATLFVFPGAMNRPRWLPEMQQVFDGVPDVRNQSHAALILFNQGGNLFALTYGHGWLYLNDDCLEGDFGLRTTVNFINDSKLKSLERANVAIAMRDVTQAARHSGLRDFGMDDALEIIRKISGTAADDSFASRATGARSLRLSVERDLTGVPALAQEAYELSRSNAYLDTAFKVIDLLQPVSDIVLERELDSKLVEAVQVGSDDFELSIPQFTGEDVSFIRFKGASGTKPYSGVSLARYRESLGPRAETVDIDRLKSHRVLAYEEERDLPIGNWTVHRSLVGSVSLGDGRYALNEGDWYKIDTGFKDSAEQHFRECLVDADPALPVLIRRCSGVGRSAGYVMEPEADYNIRAAQESGFLCLDRVLVQVDGVPGPGYEMCDLLDVDRRRLIHIKKGGRNSGVLSHLFRQGAAAANLLKASDEIKRQLVERINERYGEASAQAVNVAIREAVGWTVEYRIIDSRRRDGSFDIPFFSKLSFKDVGFRIRAMDMTPKIGFIECPDG